MRSVKIEGSMKSDFQNVKGWWIFGTFLFVAHVCTPKVAATAEMCVPCEVCTPCVACYPGELCETQCSECEPCYDDMTLPGCEGICEECKSACTTCDDCIEIGCLEKCTGCAPYQKMLECQTGPCADCEPCYDNLDAPGCEACSDCTQCAHCSDDGCHDCRCCNDCGVCADEDEPCPADIVPSRLDDSPDNSKAVTVFFVMLCFGMVALVLANMNWNRPHASIASDQRKLLSQQDDIAGYNSLDSETVAVALNGENSPRIPKSPRQPLPHQASDAGQSV